MTSKKINPSQVAQLGGLAAARKAAEQGTPRAGKNKGMSEKAALGGSVTAKRHSREHFIRAVHKRWGRNVKTMAETV